MRSNRQNQPGDMVKKMLKSCLPAVLLSALVEKFSVSRDGVKRKKRLLKSRLPAVLLSTSVEKFGVSRMRDFSSSFLSVTPSDTRRSPHIKFV